MLRLGRFVLGEVVASRSPILFLLVLSGLLRGALILVINSAAAQTSAEAIGRTVDIVAPPRRGLVASLMAANTGS